MPSASDWWARAMGRAAQPSAPPPGSTAAPRTYPGAPPYQQAPPPGEQPPIQGLYSYDAQTGAQVADDGHVAMLINAAAQTGGSRAAREGSSNCPHCNSGNYFARNRTENGAPMRNPASPRCYDCGYPVLQAGSPGGPANTVRPSGEAHRARQLPRNHAVTVLDGTTVMTYPAN